MTQLKPPRAIILAAGFGSRLVPLTNDRPKCMVSLLGKTILDRQLSAFKNAGITDVAIVTGHGADAVPQDMGLAIFSNPDYAITNMVTSLMCAREWLASGGDVMISYGDIVYTDSVLDTLLQSQNDITVCIDKGWRAYWQERMENPLSDAETMKFGNDGRIIELGKKPKSYDEIEGQYIGLQLWRSMSIPKILDFYDKLDRGAIYDGKPFQQMFMTSFIQSMINADFKIMPAVIQHGWLEVDTLDDLAMCEKLHAQNRLKELYDAV
jgi:choline kinase